MVHSQFYLIISSDDDRFYLVEAHGDENKAMERMMFYFESGINPPVDFDLLDREFPQITEIKKDQFQQLMNNLIHGYSNGYAEVMVVKVPD